MRTEQRRRVAWKSRPGATSLRVPLETAPEGEVREGDFYIPTRLASTRPDTNERHEFERVVQENFNRWTDWLRKRGWEYVTQSLMVAGITEVPRNSWDDDDEERKRVTLRARFKRSSHLYVGLDDYLAIREMAGRYGVEDNPMPWSIEKGVDTGWVNPLEHAQKRREALGLKRADYLFGPLWEPL